MHAEFWHERWATNDIGFHESQANPFLKKYIDKLELPVGSRLFLPLCGKTLDIHWLLSQGYCVVGAELNEQAVQQLFAELGLEPTVQKQGELSRYSASRIDIWVGDIFEVCKQTLGAVDAIYDRAALVALPPELRRLYTQHLRKITGRAPQLLICYDYDQQEMQGPPFAISADEVSRHYQQTYKVQLLESMTVEGGVKGRCAAVEQTWLLV